MQRAEVENFLNKQAKLVLKNGYKYRGLIVSVTDSTLQIKDIVEGKISIDIQSISAISERGNR